MNIKDFIEQFKNNLDIDSINIKCDYPLHEGGLITISKQAAKRNILKKSGKEFICRDCFMKYDNPVNRIGESRQTDEVILVYCPNHEHEGNNGREMKKSHYYGTMEEPYIQICNTCSQKGRVISDEQKDAIRKALTGIKRSDDFKQKLSDYMKNNPEGIARATKNILENHCINGMLGKKHTEETKKLMSDSHTGKEFTEEHRNNISEGRKKMLQETGGFSLEHRENLRKAAKAQYARGFNPREYHTEGWHISTKCGSVYFRSSYESKAFEKLDEDPLVISYKSENVDVEYKDAEGFAHTYIIDIEVKYLDDTIKHIEVKPAKLIKDDVVLKKEAADIYAKTVGAEYEIWTEVDLWGPVYNEKHIREYVKKLRIKIAAQKGEILTEEELDKKAKEASNKRQKKFYKSHKEERKIKVPCEYCKEKHGIEFHEIDWERYEENIQKNGRYICIKENGYIQGQKPKDYLKVENPHATEGKKQCNGPCCLVKSLDDFGNDKSKYDGKATICKTCRAEKAKGKYEDKKNQEKTD